MQIVRNKKYLEKLKSIISFIAKDNLSASIRFYTELDKHIDNLRFMPYKFRKSIYFENEDIRDLMFREYVIPYKIDTIDDKIFIIGINKHQKRL